MDNTKDHKIHVTKKRISHILKCINGKNGLSSSKTNNSENGI